jgi:hypothetical protein
VTPLRKTAADFRFAAVSVAGFLFMQVSYRYFLLPAKKIAEQNGV